MLEEYQQERIDFIKNILPYFGDKFILKGGTALSLYYGLNRYSEDLYFDCLTSNMNCINRLKQCKDFNKWNISIKKDTDTVFRFMIDYGSVSHLGKYPLKIEISSRNKSLLNSNKLKYNKFDNVNVYCIEDLIEMKAIATGNPFILEKYKIENLLKSEEEYKRYYEISIINAEKAIKQETPKAQELKGEVEALREMFNNKNFLKENYEVEVLGIKTTRKLKAMQSEKDFNAISEKIQSKIIQMLRQPDEFFTLESKERIRESNGRKNNAGEIEFLSANEIKLNFLVSVSGDDIHFKGVIITKDNHRFYPKNLNLESHRSLLVTDPFKVSSILTKLKNTFDKVSSLLENKVEELKKYENIIEAKNRYLENNTIDNYDRKPLIAMLKQDLLNMNDIFRIRQEKRKEGIKIEMDSQEIADLIPQYPKYLDEKGKLQVNAIAERKDESPLPVESLPKESKESKTDLEKEITEPKNTHLEQTAPQQEIQNIPTKKEDLQEKRKDLESKDENVAKISQNESIDIQEIAKNKIEIKDFKDKDNINNRMRILEQNMTSIQKKQHSKRMMGER